MQRRIFLALTGLVGLAGTPVMGQVDMAARQRQEEVPKKHKITPPQKQELPPAPSDLPKDTPPVVVMQARLAQLPSRLLPLTLVGERDGRRIYTRLVNEVTCHHFAGNSNGSIEWVGTGYGIKRIDKKRGEVRLYTPEDGLPGAHIWRIVGDTKEAFALVWQPNGGLAFCRLNTKTDTWETVYSLTPPPSPNGYNYNNYGEMPQGRAQLVLHKEIVVFTWGTAVMEGNNSEETALYYVYERRTKKLNPMPWDAGIKADQSKLQVYFSHIHADKLWLGTSIGLMEMPLKAEKSPAKRPAWRRVLPEYAVLNGAASDKTLFLKLVFRKSPQQSKLVRFDWETETIKDLPTVSQNLMPMSPSEYEIWNVEKDTLYCVWPKAYNNHNFRGRFGDNANIASCLKLLPDGKEWVALGVDGKTLPKINPPNDIPTFNYNFFPSAPIDIASENDLSDTIAANMLYAPENPVDSGSYSNYPARMSWFYERFSRWLSPNTSDEEITTLYEYPQYAVNSQRRQYFMPNTLPDPLDPTFVWLAEQGEFVYIPRSELPPKQRISNQPGFLPSSQQWMMPPVTSKKAERFAIANAGARHYISARFILPMSSGTTLVGASNNPTLALVDGHEVTPVLFPDRQFPGESNILNTFVAGPKGHAFVWDFPEETLRRWDESSKTFLPTTIAARTNGQWLGATRASLWRREGDKGPEYLSINNAGKSQGDWQVAPIPFDDGKSPTRPQYLRIACDVLWYRRYDDHGLYTIFGWDDITKRAIATMSIEASDNFSITYGHDEKIYLLSGRQKGMLHCYDRKANAWSLIGEVPKAPNETNLSSFEGRMLIGVSNAIWILTPKHLLRLDQSTKQWSWSSHTLPIYTLGDNSLIIQHNQRGIVWIGQDNGLWRFDPMTEKITETTRPVQIQQEMYGSIDVVQVTPDAVWAKKGMLLARLDRATKKASWYGLESGANRNENMSVCVAGGELILFDRVYNTAPFYFVREKNRFEPLLKETEKDPSKETLFQHAATDPQNPKEVLLANNHYASMSLYRWSKSTKEVTKIECNTHLFIFGLYTLDKNLYAATMQGLYRWNVPLSDWQLLVPLSIRSFSPDAYSLSVVWASDGVNYIKIEAPAPIESQSI
jgi:hypothetical protein